MPSDAVSQHDQDALLRRLRDMEARARSLERQLEASDRLAAVGALAAGLAHEFNNLLTPMSGLARLALAGPADADLARRALESAVAAADRGSGLAASILTLAGDALGPPRRMSDSVANVAHAVEGALACVARDPARDGVRVRIHAPPTLAAAMPQPALRQILLSLILNALHAMRATSGGDLAITAERSTWNSGNTETPLQTNSINNADWPSEPVGPPPAHPRDSAPSRSVPCIRITVADTGPGVPPDLLPHIFEPFVTTRAAPAGDADAIRCAGLGLAICRRLVRAAGGDIAAENARPAGARFTIVLPEAEPPLSPRKMDQG